MLLGSHCYFIVGSTLQGYGLFVVGSGSTKEKHLSLLSDIFVNEEVQTEVETPPGKILIVTSCTKDKDNRYNLAQHQQLSSDQLWDEGCDDRAARNFGDLEKYRIPAGQLYRGRQHLQLMQGVELLRQVFGPNSVDVKIISAGFGVVDED